MVADGVPKAGRLCALARPRRSRLSQPSAAGATWLPQPRKAPLPAVSPLQHSEARGSSPSGDVPPPPLPRPPPWELGNLRTWAGLGLAQLELTLAQGLGFLSKSMGLAGLQRDN